MDNYYVSKLLPLMAEARIQVVANPLINITLQGRHDTYPKRRGMTRVKELLEAGVNVAFGQDALMDPWYSMGSYDMLEVAHMGLHVAQMTGVEQMQQMFAAVTTNGAQVMGLKDYGLRAGLSCRYGDSSGRQPPGSPEVEAGQAVRDSPGNRDCRNTPGDQPAKADGQAYEVDFRFPADSN